MEQHLRRSGVVITSTLFLVQATMEVRGREEHLGEEEREESLGEEEMRRREWRIGRRR